MQRRQSAREVLQSVREKLASAADSNSAPRSPDVLQQVADLLSRGRGYSWVGIYLAVEDTGAAEASSVALAESASDSSRSTRLPESKSEMVVPIKIGIRTLGMIDVESRAGAVSRQERVLLGQVAAAIAQYLTTNRGKLRRRQARAQAASVRPESRPQKGPQSARPEKSRAAAGEHSTR
jgi:putative methionine-R-sulfoxide reductase with GAF domain